MYWYDDKKNYPSIQIHKVYITIFMQLLNNLAFQDMHAHNSFGDC